MATKRHTTAKHEREESRSARTEPRPARKEPRGRHPENGLASGVLTGLHEMAGQLQEVITRLESIVEQLVGSTEAIGRSEPAAGQAGGEQEARPEPGQHQETARPPEPGPQGPGGNAEREPGLVPTVLSQLQEIVTQVSSPGAKAPAGDRKAAVIEQLQSIVKELERAPGRRDASSPDGEQGNDR